MSLKILKKPEIRENQRKKFEKFRKPERYEKNEKLKIKKRIPKKTFLKFDQNKKFEKEKIGEGSGATFYGVIFVEDDDLVVGIKTEVRSSSPPAVMEGV